MHLSVFLLSGLISLAALSFAGNKNIDTVTLADGQVIEAPILKETSEALWLDLGETVLRVDRKQISDIKRANNEIKPAREKQAGLYRTAEDLPQRTPRELAAGLGAAVVVVQTPSGTGSGFIINPEGYTITNAHVIQGEKEIKCVMFRREGRDFRRRVINDVEIIAVNNHLDLALLKLKNEENTPFPTVYLQKDEKLDAGQEVFAIGAPLGLERTLSEGVIATSQRSFNGLTYIQTTAQINPGNSGGPLFNTRGEVIGVTNMKITMGEGLGFAIPIRYVKVFLNNRDAFASDSDNPTPGYDSLDPPRRLRFSPPPELDDEG